MRSWACIGNHPLTKLKFEELEQRKRSENDSEALIAVFATHVAAALHSDCTSALSGLIHSSFLVICCFLQLSPLHLHSVLSAGK